MTKLGSWSTFDCPVSNEDIDKAYDWLKDNVREIGGQVRKQMNPHDFGSYPSFEIDAPEGDEYDEDDEGNPSFAMEKFMDEINDIEKLYTEMFFS